MKNTTDGTERLLFVSRLVHEGDEAGLKRAIERNFPAEAFERAGLVGFTAHVGGGYCVLEFGFEGPFDPIFESLEEDREATRYLDLLGRHVDPPPRIAPGRTADLPLAADQFLWRAESGVASRKPARRVPAARPASGVARGDGGNLGSSRSRTKTPAAAGGTAKSRPRGRKVEGSSKPKSKSGGTSRRAAASGSRTSRSR